MFLNINFKINEQKMNVHINLTLQMLILLKKYVFTICFQIQSASKYYIFCINFYIMFAL